MNPLQKSRKKLADLVRKNPFLIAAEKQGWHARIADLPMVAVRGLLKIFTANQKEVETVLMDAFTQDTDGTLLKKLLQLKKEKMKTVSVAFHTAEEKNADATVDELLKNL